MEEKEYIFIKWSKGEPYEQSKKDDNPNYFIETEYNVTTSFGQEGFTRGNTKKENLNNKLNDRNLIGQVNQNPFLTNSDYLRDIETQQNFLIPQNSNFKGQM
jgi:hypothetical protein